MDGITAIASGETAVLVLEHVSSELKDFLKERLAAFCHGSALVAEDADYYSFAGTITEFLRRYDTKPLATRIGMAGELAIHAMMPSSHPSLSSCAVFFNKEERSIKKGFDLTFHETGTETVWYAEVKSGETHNGETVDDKSSSLLKTAAADIAGKLSQDAQRSRWDAAIIDAGLTLESRAATSVKALLRSDSNELVGTNATGKKSVVLAATVLHSPGHCQLSAEAAADVSKKIADSGSFKQTRVLVFQQEELNTIVGFLRAELTQGA